MKKINPITIIDVVVFSKNRACQLDLTLRSILHNVKLLKSITVIYLAENQFYEDGYGIVKNLYPSIRFIKQTILKADLLEVIKDIDSYYLPMADDCLIIRQIVYDKIFKNH